MSDFIKIAITGRARSGKTEIDRHLSYRYGLDSTSFGLALKYYAELVFSHTPEFNTGFGRRKPRRLYRDFGQHCRQIDQDVWIRHVAFKLSETEADTRSKGLIVSDLRQPNEYDWLRANGFTIIRVNAPTETRLDRAQQAGDVFNRKDFEHETEQTADTYDVDYEVDNTGGIEDLHAKVDAIMAELGVEQVRGYTDWLTD